MRICILSYRGYSFSGGQGIYMRYLSNALRDLGHEVDLISGPPYPIVDEGVGLIKIPGLDLYTMPPTQRMLINPGRLNTFANFAEWAGAMTGYFSEPLAFGMRAYKFITGTQSKKYDVIHDNQTLAYGIAALKRAGYPVVGTIHHPVTLDRDLAIQSCNSLIDKLGYRRWFSFTGMQVRVAQQLGHIITVSEMAKRHIEEVFHIPAEKLRVIYNGIDTKLFSPSDSLQREKNLVLMVMSRDTVVKGLKYLLEAFASIHEKHNLHLVIVGETMGDGATESLIARLGLNGHVTFRNRIETDELIALYRRATLVAVPSTYEGFGLPAAEAMACGAPVVSTTAGALPEVIGDAGILVPPADPAALAAAISGLLENSGLQQELSIKGRKRIVEQFSWKDAARQTAEVYAEAVEGRRSR